MIEDGKDYVEVLRSVSDFYRNVARMLLSCDEVLMDENCWPYDEWKWQAIWPVHDGTLKAFVCKTPHEQPQWIPEFVLRQYYPEKDKDKVVLTVAAVLWLSGCPAFSEPLCVASFVRGGPFDEDDIYRISILQSYLKDQAADGIVRIIGKDNLGQLPAPQKEKFLEVVEGGEFASVALPLLKIANVHSIKDDLIKPLLAQTGH